MRTAFALVVCLWADRRMRASDLDARGRLCLIPRPRATAPSVRR